MGHPPSHDSGFNTMARIPRNSPNKLLGGSLRLGGKTGFQNELYRVLRNG